MPQARRVVLIILAIWCSLFGADEASRAGPRHRPGTAHLQGRDQGPARRRRRQAGARQTPPSCRRARARRPSRPAAHRQSESSRRSTPTSPPTSPPAEPDHGTAPRVLRRTFVRLYSAKPSHPVGADGRMALVDHLRELRARRAARRARPVVGLVVALFFYDQLFELVLGPLQRASDALRARASSTEATIDGAGGPLDAPAEAVRLVAALVLTSPFWLYQIWAFILPGLHAQRAEVDADLRRDRRAAVPGRCRCSATTCCPRASRS